MHNSYVRHACKFWETFSMPLSFTDAIQVKPCLCLFFMNVFGWKKNFSCSHEAGFEGSAIGNGGLHFDCTHTHTYTLDGKSPRHEVVRTHVSHFYHEERGENWIGHIRMEACTCQNKSRSSLLHGGPTLIEEAEHLAPKAID